MKVVHICLTAGFQNGMGYQENLLAKYHLQMGFEVTAISPATVHGKDGTMIPNPNPDISTEGVRLRNVPRSNRYGWISKFSDFDYLQNVLEEESPDIIFVHGGTFWAIRDVIRYCRQHPAVALYIDHHSDYYNTPTRTWKQQIAHSVILGSGMRKAVRYCRKFWGVTPWRCRHLHEVYGIPKNKIDLLVMGADDEKIRWDLMPGLRTEIRKKLNLRESDFVIVTGGRIDRAKNIHLLMQAVSELNRDNIKLILFGTPTEDMTEEITELSKDPHIRWIGWLPSDAVYDYFLTSDLAVFPGTHSVLWEQACGCGIPMMVKRWTEMDHVDVGGNCLFLTEDSVEELKQRILELYENREQYEMMKKIGIEKAVPAFSYRKIARKAIGMENEIS